MRAPNSYLGESAGAFWRAAGAAFALQVDQGLGLDAVGGLLLQLFEEQMLGTAVHLIDFLERRQRGGRGQEGRGR